MTSLMQSRRGIRDRFRAPTLVLALASALAVAGCGGTAASAAPGAATTAPAPVATTAASTAASAAATTAGGTASCGADVAAAIKAHLARADVVEVTIIGGCHQANITTTLAPTDITAGLAICDSAAKVGYTGVISSITVVAANGKELAAGLENLTCLGEP